jgi:hypothetical protein
MRACLVAFVLIALSTSCGGATMPCVQNGLCSAPAGNVYFSVTNAASGAAVANATFVSNTPYGPQAAQSVRVTSIPDGPFAGPCDCYRLLLPAGQSQLVVQAAGFSQVPVAVDLGHAAAMPPPAGGCQSCEGPPPGSGSLFRIALQKN